MNVQYKTNFTQVHNRAQGQRIKERMQIWGNDLHPSSEDRIKVNGDSGSQGGPLHRQVRDGILFFRLMWLQTFKQEQVCNCIPQILTVLYFLSPFHMEVSCAVQIRNWPDRRLAKDIQTQFFLAAFSRYLILITWYSRIRFQFKVLSFSITLSEPIHFTSTRYSVENTLQIV